MGIYGKIIERVCRYLDISKIVEEKELLFVRYLLVVSEILSFFLNNRKL